MKIGERVRIKAGVWAGTVCVISAINKGAAYPITITERNGREHCESAANVVKI